MCLDHAVGAPDHAAPGRQPEAGRSAVRSHPQAQPEDRATSQRCKPKYMFSSMPYPYITYILRQSPYTIHPISYDILNINIIPHTRS